ncbi:MAG: hypothetical protein RML46_00350 [Anaerolineae bacterium]|nr:hypothetical protein [Anaerolineae bacterium]MDW8067344.1 hypothetical protein [Anaerolineae bacterium]
MRPPRAAPKRDGGRWGLIGGLAFIAALGLAILLMWPAAGPEESRIPAGPLIPLPLEPTAREAFRAAGGVARAWQPDARPASLSAQWQPIRGRWPTQSIWTVLYYAPAAGRMAVVVVEAGQAWLLQEMPIPYPLPVFTEDRWLVDSPQALKAWWVAGGADFLARYKNAGVTARLKPTSMADPSPVWTITTTAGTQVHTLMISGVDGRVLP